MKAWTIRENGVPVVSVKAATARAALNVAAFAESPVHACRAVGRPVAIPVARRMKAQMNAGELAADTYIVAGCCPHCGAHVKVRSRVAASRAAS